MAEMILPGTYIEVRPEGLIVPGRVTVGNIGIVGTASKGKIGKATVLGSYTEARAKFGDYDSWIDPTNDQPRADALSLVRALQLAFAHGATTVVAVRVAKDAKAAAYKLQSPGGDNVTLEAKSEGEWGNDLAVNVAAADEGAVVEETHNGPTVTLKHTPARSARNRILVNNTVTGITRRMRVLFKSSQPDDDPDPQPGQDPPEVIMDGTPGGTPTLTFGDPITGDDKVTVNYVVAPASSRKVIIRLGRNEEVYTVVSGDDLLADINRTPGGSTWVTAKKEANSAELPSDLSGFGAFKGGDNGAAATSAEYEEGLRSLLNEDAHIIIAAGQDTGFGDELNAHCQTASTDAIRRDRIGVVGSALGADLDTIRGHNFDSDRIIFVAPGLRANDAISGKEVTLPGSYAAAAVAGMLAALPPHISPTNKPLSVGGLEHKYTNAELTQLVQSRVLALEQRQGFRVLKGITTSTNTAWHQITTRRIVDYAKYGVRSAASSYIGLLNNERVRGALQSTIASFLNQMLVDEMLVSYDLSVSATREEERQGIVQVTMVLRPVFSIDFIKVTMFLE